MASCQMLRDRDVVISVCSWCSRDAIGREGITPEEQPNLPTSMERLTHTICTDCAARLREPGEWR
jgi:hypothetical protein